MKSFFSSRNNSNSAATSVSGDHQHQHNVMQSSQPVSILRKPASSTAFNPQGSLSTTPTAASVLAAGGTPDDHEGHQLLMAAHEHNNALVKELMDLRKEKAALIESQQQAFQLEQVVLALHAEMQKLQVEGSRLRKLNEDLERKLENEIADNADSRLRWSDRERHLLKSLRAEKAKVKDLKELGAIKAEPGYDNDEADNAYMTSSSKPREDSPSSRADGHFLQQENAKLNEQILDLSHRLAAKDMQIDKQNADILELQRTVNALMDEIELGYEQAQFDLLGTGLDASLMGKPSMASLAAEFESPVPSKPSTPPIITPVASPIPKQSALTVSPPPPSVAEVVITLSEDKPPTEQAITQQQQETASVPNSTLTPASTPTKKKNRNRSRSKSNAKRRNSLDDETISPKPPMSPPSPTPASNTSSSSAKPSQSLAPQISKLTLSSQPSITSIAENILNPPKTFSSLADELSQMGESLPAAGAPVSSLRAKVIALGLNPEGNREILKKRLARYVMRKKKRAAGGNGGGANGKDAAGESQDEA